MSQMNVVAHPYAQAIFNLAKAQNTESRWLANLEQVKQILSNQNFVEFIHNPLVDSLQIIALLKSVLGEQATPEVINLLQILAENKRVHILPEIFRIFRELVLDDQQRCDALIESAYAMGQDEQQDFEKRLSQKIGKTVTARVKINPELMAGVKITINDKVIDGSVKGRLSDLATQLTK